MRRTSHSILRREFHVASPRVPAVVRFVRDGEWHRRGKLEVLRTPIIDVEARACLERGMPSLARSEGIDFPMPGIGRGRIVGEIGRACSGS